MELMEHQLEASEKLSSGKILYGDVGVGKSATVLHYYMQNECPRDIYVITTAKKRDSLDWEREAAHFGISTEVFLTNENYRKHRGVLTVDSWNKIDEYTDIEDAFFIFDEQRLVGSGAWVKAFQKIAKKNHWVLLTATPGDTWMDYIPVFVANGFYRNATDFKRKHVLYEPFVKFPIVRGYLGEQKLEILRNDMLVEMPYLKHTERMLNWMSVDYDKELYKRIYKERWNIFENKPVKDVAEMWRLMRRLVNSDPSRLQTVRDLMKIHPRLIVFYNFNYELEILRQLYLQPRTHDVYEWNGHRKDHIPDDGNWVYLVQYVAGAEGWNCTSTDAMVLYSLTYSYKNFEQVQGRIDRLNTLYTTLYYYVFLSNSVVDGAIKRSLDAKQNFNERKWLQNHDLKSEESDIETEKSEEHLESCQI